VLLGGQIWENLLTVLFCCEPEGDEFLRKSCVSLPDRTASWKIVTFVFVCGSYLLGNTVCRCSCRNALQFVVIV
jgi:hypothetical protein